MKRRDGEAMEVVDENRHQSFKDAVARSATTHADDCLSYEFYSESGSRVMLKSLYQIDPETNVTIRRGAHHVQRRLYQAIARRGVPRASLEAWPALYLREIPTRHLVTWGDDRKSWQERG